MDWRHECVVISALTKFTNEHNNGFFFLLQPVTASPRDKRTDAELDQILFHKKYLHVREIGFLCLLI